MAEIINIIHEPEIPDIQSGNVRFDINPHIVRQLGGELVPDDITALMELVKNAYDADSPYVRININTKESYGDEKLKYPNNKGYIIIGRWRIWHERNGHSEILAHYFVFAEKGR